jgi:hypothetical protein
VTKQFWIFLVVGLAIVGALVYGVLMGTKGAHIDLVGEILKVRVLSVNPEASLVMVDFRVTNPADYPFVVSAVQMELDRAGAETVEGRRSPSPMWTSPSNMGSCSDRNTTTC